MNHIHVSYQWVTPTLPLADVIPLTPHPAAENAPYVPQGMAGMNLFDTFEEEHMETPALPRYNTRYRARQHSANQAHFLAPHILRPTAFTNNQSIAVTPTQAPNPIPMANAVINQETGASLEYCHLIQDETTFTFWNTICGYVANLSLVIFIVKDSQGAAQIGQKEGAPLLCTCSTTCGLKIGNTNKWWKYVQR
jgi:hypothetical protein